MERKIIMAAVEMANRFSELINKKDEEIERLQSQLADMQKDYLRRHKDACDRWIVLSLLVDKLNKIEEDSSFQGIWSYLASHNYIYTGPNYKDELDTARKLLSGDQKDDPKL